MVQPAAAVAAFHGLLDSVEYADLGWAQRLQEEMRGQGLTESGRLVNPVLRPHFISRAQFHHLGRVASCLSRALQILERAVLESPALLNRLRLLPAEKALVMERCGLPGAIHASGLRAAVENGSVSLRGIDTNAGLGLAYSHLLADLFLRLPIMRDLGKMGFRFGKCGGVDDLLSCVLQAWREFGGERSPNIGILEFKQSVPCSDGELIAQMFRERDAAAQVVNPEQLECWNGKLRAGQFAIDVLLRRVRTRDLLVQYDLSHPVFRAYRAGAACVINGFRSELWQRRAVFELLTDATVFPECANGEQTCIAGFIPWTRIVSARKTSYRDETIDLIPFLERNRERFLLAPNDMADDGDLFTGAELTQRDWERALRIAAQRSYVAQEHTRKPSDAFPVFRYNSLEVQRLSVTILPSVFDGKVQGASAALESGPANNGRRVAIAPVLALD